MLGLPYRHIHQQASSFSPSFQGYLTIQPQRQLYGIYGRGSVDYGFDLRTSGATGGVTEVRRDNFGNGIAQNMVQLEACLIRLYISLFSHYGNRPRANASIVKWQPVLQLITVLQLFMGP